MMVADKSGSNLMQTPIDDKINAIREYGVQREVKPILPQSINQPNQYQI
jgi:hypothetical protein